MSYPYSFDAHKNDTHKQKKNKKNKKSHRDKITFDFFCNIFNEPSSFYIHNNTQTHKANKSLK